MFDLDSIRGKIRALLAKTTENGCTEQEAFAALEKAQAMMDAYAVTPEQLELTKGECIVIKAHAKGHDPRGVKGNLGGAIAEFCDCKWWWSSTRQEFLFCGYAPDAELASWLLDSLHQFVMNELTNHLMRNPCPPSMKMSAAASFIYGATSRISERMRQLRTASKAEVTSTGRALVVAKDRVIRSHMRDQGIHLKHRSRARSIRDSASMNAGREAGDRASFGRPVGGSAGALRLK